MLSSVIDNIEYVLYVPSTEEIVRTLRGMATLPLPLLVLLPVMDLQLLLRTRRDDDAADVIEGFEGLDREGAFPDGG